MITVRMGRLDEADTKGLLRPVRSDLSGISGASRRVDSAVGASVRAPRC